MTLELLTHGRVAPVAAYLGGKRAYAASIVEAMGGWQRPERLQLCDAGPWGWWWRMMLVEGQGDRMAHALGKLAEHRLQGVDLHQWLCETAPADDIGRAAAFVALQASAARGKPVEPLDGGRWRTAGYAHLSDAARVKGFRERLNPVRLAQRVRRVASVAWPDVDVVHDDVACAKVLGGRVVIDAPYKGTTGYPMSLERAALVETACVHAQGGALVGVCEAEPVAELGALGWQAHRMARRGGWQRRAWGGTEWLTMTAAPRLPQPELGLRARVDEALAVGSPRSTTRRS